jgi:hypothetical protein
LDHELREIAESQGSLGLGVALCRGGKDGANGVADIRGGKDIGGDELADLASGFRGFKAGAVFLAVVVTEAEVVGELREGAAASVGVSEVTQFAMIVIFGHRNSPEEKSLDWKWKRPRGARAWLATGKA